MINLCRRLVPLSLCLVVVAACSSSSTASARAAADPSIKQSVSVAPPTPTPSPEPTTNAAIEAGFRRWLGAVNTAFATGNTKPLADLTSPACACRRLQQNVRAYWSKGSIRGLTWTLRSYHLVDVRHGLADIQYEVDEPTYWVIDGGRLSSPHRADTISVLAEFQLANGIWRMVDYDQLKVRQR
jgi:hypothetical protein